MGRRKVLIAEVELCVRRVYEQELDHPSHEPGSSGGGSREVVEHVILDMGPRPAPFLGRVLGDNESLAVVLSRSSPPAGQTADLWSARACILDATRISRLKESESGAGEPIALPAPWIEPDGRPSPSPLTRAIGGGFA